MSEAAATEPVRPAAPPAGPTPAGARTVLGAHLAAAVALVVGLVVTSALAVAAWSSHEASEDRLMDRRTREAAAVFSTAATSLEGSLSSVAEVVAATSGHEATFRAVMRDMVGDGRSYSSASVWSLDGAAPGLLTVVGERPALADAPPEEISAALSATSRPGLHVIDLLDGESPRLGYTYGSDMPTTRVAYVESTLPENRTSVPQRGSAFADLHYAVYLGEVVPDRLVVADTADLPLEGRQSSEVLPLGDTELVLVMSSTAVLGSRLSASLTWLILGLGVPLSILFAVLYERVLRRRDDAGVLAAELALVAQDNARLYGEQRSVAQTLQQSLLLEELPSAPGLELAARYEAGAEGVDIGGDWYDVIVRDEDCLLLVVGDVSGRGSRAATVMAALRYSIRALAVRGDACGTILATLSRLVSVEGDGHFATVLLAELDPRRGSLAIVSAGHPSPLVVEDGRARFIECDVGVPVGVVQDPVYATVHWQLAPGATLLAFTDGLFERRGETVDAGLERLRAQIEVSAALSLDELLDGLVESFAGTTHDDAAILAVRWPTNPTTPPS